MLLTGKLKKISSGKVTLNVSLCLKTTIFEKLNLSRI